jgi:hypothetical protein
MNTIRRPLKDFPKSIDAAFLAAFKDQTVEDFCPQSKTAGRFSVGDSDNHCAHFVGHALGLRFGELCLSEKFFGDDGRSMRVDEIFTWCADRGPWADRPKTLDPCLIFATLKNNVITPKQGPVEFGQSRFKHVGIWLKGAAWNYHNGRSGPEGVVGDGEHFFLNLYGSKTVCFYGSFPT